ncbi:MAG: Fur family transcriptional regulator [Bacillota bacterium]|nr:Fur family transcriptional regulator [Bacillota bacterium]
MPQQSNKQKLFASKGIKSTKQRNMVFDILEEFETPVSVEQIHLKLSEVDSTVNMSTVYRILEVFVNKGLVLKTNIMGTNSAGFILNRLEHKHQLVCLKCNKIVPINKCPLNKLEQLMREETDFEIMGHKLEVFGYCPDCKERDK